MNIFNLFKRAPSISPAEARTYVEQRRLSEYRLLDVRQPVEYEQGHLPGALLIPLSDLQGSLGHIDQDKTVIVYCRSGNRSLSATNLLRSAGFKNVFNMDGGILSYGGTIASGPPEGGMFCFPERLSPEQLVTVAWFLESGALRFLEEVRTGILSTRELAVLDALIAEKRSHTEKLKQLYVDLVGRLPDDFPKRILEFPDEDVMAGCIRVSDALGWTRGKTVRDVIEVLISLAANTFDLYLKLGRTVRSEEARGVFTILAQEEHNNIRRSAQALEGLL